MLLGNRGFSQQNPATPCENLALKAKVSASSEFSADYADVAADRSACFKVPAETPVHFQILDSQDRNLQRMRTFTHFMPGEVQGCTGCHSDRNSLNTQSRSNTQFTALKPPEWGLKGFSYREVVQPVLDQYCISCHTKDIPRTFYIRVEKPELNNFLLAPLAKSAGGSETCSKPIFASKDDPDYQAILKTFEPIRQTMKDQPRDDMP